VNAAADLIFEQGVAHTTIEDVRAAADVSSSQLYHYFDDKPALVRAVVDHQADTIVAGQETFDLSSFDGLRAWRDWVIEHQRELNCSGGCPIAAASRPTLTPTHSRSRSLPHYKAVCSSPRSSATPNRSKPPSTRCSN